MKRSVLFVCTANICRSTMAMGLMREKVSSSDDEWHIDSAGVWADPGFPPAQNTQLVLASRGITVSEHRSQAITPQMIRDFDLILVMERNHQEALRAAFPGDAARILMMTEIVGGSMDIVDPVGGSPVDYEDTAVEIEGILEKGFDEIIRLIDGS